MAFNFRKILKGLKLIPEASDTTSEQGDLQVTSGDSKLNYHNGSTSSPVVTEAHASTLTNKTIAGGSNTISGLAHGVAVDDPSTGVHGVTGTVVGNSDAQTLTNKTIDADLNTVSNLAHGAEVDNPTTGVHGVTGTVVGTSDAQTLTTKTIDADNNTISNLAHGAEVDNPSSGVHGATGTIVGTTDAQTLTNKTIVAGSNTISGLLHGTQVDNPSSGVHGVTGSVVGTTDAQTLTNKTLTSPVINTGDIDGITASNTSRITLPKDTKTNLDALTRKEGTLVYASDENAVYADNGSTLVELAAGSGTTVDNAWTSYTLTIGNSAGTAPTYGTASVNKAYYMQVGKILHIKYNLITTNTGGNNGTAGGIYTFPIPGGFTIDTALFGLGAPSGDLPSQDVVGDAGWDVAGSSATANMYVFDSTHLYMIGILTATSATIDTYEVTGGWGPGSNSGASTEISFSVQVPIT